MQSHFRNLSYLIGTVLILGLLTAGLSAATFRASGSNQTAHTQAASSATPSASSTSMGTVATTTVSLTESDSSMTLSRSSVPAGVVVLNLKNTGNNQHGLTILRTPLSVGNFPVQAGNIDVSNSQVTTIASYGSFAPGQSSRVLTYLNSGHYVLVSNRNGDYTAGVVSSLTVTSSGAPMARIAPGNGSGTDNRAGTPTSSPTIMLTSTATTSSTAASGSSSNGGGATASATSTGIPPLNFVAPSNNNPSTPTNIRVVEGSYFIFSSPTTISGGKTIFHITNVSGLPHGFWLLRTDLAARMIPLQNGVNKADLTSSKITVVAKKTPLAPGASTTVTVDNLQPGHYVIISNQPADYSNGMLSVLKVNPPAASSAASTPQSLPGTVVQVMVGTDFLRLTPSRVITGTVTFQFKQYQGARSVVLLRTTLAPAQLPYVNGHLDLSNPGVTMVKQFSPDSLGSNPTVTIQNLQPGHYVMVSDLAKDYNQGVYAALTVLTKGPHQPSVSPNGPAPNVPFPAPIPQQ